MTDKIDAAIAETDQSVDMIEIPVQIASTKRPAIIAIPADCTDGELAELCGWMLTQVLGSLRAKAARSPLVVAKRIPPQ